MLTRVKLSAWWILPVALFSEALLAFGADAHRIVGYVAEAELCESAKTKVSQMLDGESLADAGLWADKVRGYREWDYAKPWHYINIADSDPVVNKGSAEDPDIIWAIDAMLDSLRDPELGPTNRKNALRFFIHLVADVHQPLHVGRSEDRGGNSISVKYRVSSETDVRDSNLHRYWDTDALRLSTRDPRDYAEKLLGETIPRIRLKEAGSPLDWAAESKGLREKVYSFQSPAAGSVVYLGSEYHDQAMLILELRMSWAGLRLASKLNGIFCAAAPE